MKKFSCIYQSEFPFELEPDWKICSYFYNLTHLFLSLLSGQMSYFESDKIRCE